MTRIAAVPLNGKPEILAVVIPFLFLTVTMVTLSEM